MASYQYSPLREDRNQIRLLSLHPGDFSAEIHISIQKVALTADNPPVYEALSYVWGKTENPVDIKVKPSGQDSLHLARESGPADQDRLSITQNLATALPYLRYKDRIRILWIDAICINQRDLRERSNQVKRMGDVYRLADRVVVWLGSEEDNSGHVLGLLSHVGSKVKVDMVAGTMSGAASDSNLFWSDITENLPHFEQGIDGLDSFFHRPWFSRLWVWQEILLANDTSIIICGSEIVSWRILHQAAFCIASIELQHSLTSRVPEKSRLQITLEKILTATQPAGSAPLGGTIRRMASFECSDPKDRVYAVLNLVNKRDKDITIEPDYAKTTAEIYQDSFLRYIFYHQRLDMLVECELQDDRPAGMPTWVPDRGSGFETMPLQSTGLASGHSFAAGPYKGKGLLSVKGVISATVSKAENMVFQDSPFAEICRVAPPNVEHGAYITGETQMNAFVTTIYASYYRHTFRPPRLDLPEFEEIRDFVLAVLPHRDYVLPIPADSPIPSPLRMASMILYACKNRSFISTKEGYIGLAPKAAEPGDQVAIILGCRKPMLLRPTLSGLQYQVVGECFVNGLSNGEALLGPLPDAYQAVNVYTNDVYRYAFINKQAGTIHYHDPRISVEDQNFEESAPSFVAPDGKKIPTLTANVLERRGVKLQQIDLT